MGTQKTVDFSPVNVLASEGTISQHSLIGGFLYGGTMSGRTRGRGGGNGHATEGTGRKAGKAHKRALRLTWPIKEQSQTRQRKNL